MSSDSLPHDLRRLFVYKNKNAAPKTENDAHIEEMIGDFDTDFVVCSRHLASPSKFNLDGVVKLRSYLLHKSPKAAQQRVDFSIKRMRCTNHVKSIL